MGLSGTDYVDIRAFLNDLTYNEVHAFVMGFGPAFFGVVAWFMGMNEVATAAFVTVPVLFGVAFRLREAPAPKLKILPNNPWYLCGGVVLGVVGAVLLGPILSVFGP